MRTLSLALILLVAGVSLASAQVVVADPDSTVFLGSFVDFVLPIVLTIVTAIVGVAATLLTAWLNEKFHLDIEASKRDALQTTFTNAAGRIIQELGHRARDLKLDIHNPVVAAAVNRAIAGAPDALKWANLTQEEIARRILEKVALILPPAQPPKQASDLSNEI